MTGSRNLSALIALPLAVLLTAWAACAGEGPVDAQGRKTARPEADAELNQLLKDRYESAAKMLQIEETQFQRGISTMWDVYEAWRLVVESFVELQVSPKERVAMLEKYVAFMRRLEPYAATLVRGGLAGPSQQARAQYLRADAEIRLLRAKREATVAH